MYEGKIIKDKINLNQVIENLMTKSSSKGCGALVLFLGFVKEVVDDKKVYRLEYEAYEPHASRILNEIARKLSCRDGVNAVLIYHRVGLLKPSEPIVYVFVVAKGRREAFEVAREAIEKVKHELPITKLEVRSDGEYWVVGEKRVKRNIK